MFKMSFTIYRRPDLTREQFLHHWENIHAPIAVKYMKALRIRKYVQLHAVESEATQAMRESRNCLPPHDGVVEIWWDSEEDRLKAAQDPEAQIAGKLLREDELNFVDMSRSSVMFGHEHVVIEDGRAV